jgi:hypothetical protein
LWKAEGDGDYTFTASGEPSDWGVRGELLARGETPGQQDVAIGPTVMEAAEVIVVAYPRQERRSLGRVMMGSLYVE